RVARVAAGRKRVGADAEYRIVRCRWVSNGGIAFALAGEHAFMRPEIRLGRKQRTGAALARRTLRKKGRGVFQHGKQSTAPARLAVGGMTALDPYRIKKTDQQGHQQKRALPPAPEAQTMELGPLIFLPGRWRQARDKSAENSQLHSRRYYAKIVRVQY